MAMGTLAMKQPAISEPQKYTSPCTRNVGTPTLTAYCDASEKVSSALPNFAEFHWLTQKTGLVSALQKS